MTPFLYAKIPLIDYHLDNPSTGFSVEPKRERDGLCSPPFLFNLATAMAITK